MAPLFTHVYYQICTNSAGSHTCTCLGGFTSSSSATCLPNPHTAVFKSYSPVVVPKPTDDCADCWDMATSPIVRVTAPAGLVTSSDHIVDYHFSLAFDGATHTSSHTLPSNADLAIGYNVGCNAVLPSSPAFPSDHSLRSLPPIPTFDPSLPPFDPSLPPSLPPIPPSDPSLPPSPSPSLPQKPSNPTVYPLPGQPFTCDVYYTSRYVHSQNPARPDDTIKTSSTISVDLTSVYQPPPCGCTADGDDGSSIDFQIVQVSTDTNVYFKFTWTDGSTCEREFLFKRVDPSTGDKVIGRYGSLNALDTTSRANCGQFYDPETDETKVSKGEKDQVKSDISQRRFSPLPSLPSLP